MIKAISFDIGGTLLKLPENCSAKQVLANHFNVETSVFKDAYKKHFIEKIDSFDDFCMKVQCKNPSEILYIITQYYLKKPENNLHEDVIDIISKLKSLGLYMIAISNKSYLNPFYLKTYGIDNYFNKEIYSYQVGSAKPDEKIFKIAQTLTGVSPNEIIHVGDSFSTDIVGAKAVGWYTVFIKRKGQYLQNNTLLNKDADFVITNLALLISIINYLNQRNY